MANRFNPGDKVQAIVTQDGVRKGQIYIVARYSANKNGTLVVEESRYYRPHEDSFQLAEGGAALKTGDSMIVLTATNGLKVGDKVSFVRLSTVFPNRGYVKTALGEQFRVEMDTVQSTAKAGKDVPARLKVEESKLAKVFAEIERQFAAGSNSVTLTKTGNTVTVSPASLPRTKKFEL